MKTSRGFTLIELMIACTIMLVAVTLAGALLVGGVNLTRTANQRADEADWSRLAMNQIVNDVENAANGASQGVWVAAGGTTPTLVGAISGVNGTDGNGTTSLACPDTGSGAAVAPSTDDLWLVVPDRNAMREACKDPGAATTIMASGTGPIRVGCTESFTTGDTLLVTNMNTAALLSSVKVTTAETATKPGVLDFAESGTNLSDSPDRGGFQVGDMVYRAKLVHYFIRNDPNGLKDVDGNPIQGLYRSIGALSGSASSGYPNGGYPQAGRPFYDATTTVVQPYVDDLQIAYGFDTTGTGNPANFQWKNGLTPTICSGVGTTAATLRAVRITLEIRSAEKARDNRGTMLVNSDTQHQVIEDNFAITPQPAADGYRRVLYTRTIELPNLAPGSL